VLGFGVADHDVRIADRDIGMANRSVWPYITVTCLTTIEHGDEECDESSLAPLSLIP
jgi:hypothetical protein